MENTTPSVISSATPSDATAVAAPPVASKPVAAEKKFAQWLERVRSAYSEAELASFTRAYDEMRQSVGDGVNEAGEAWPVYALG
ncbi:MAG: hypothetical protein LBB65_06190, partial [Burkholderiales bacterium]|nr:hypothetical protein [Burkholderiales bacterium]